MADDRPSLPNAADETTTLLAFLELQRSLVAWKAGGLDAAGLDATLPPSTMTLGGLLKHLVYVEDFWFSRWLHGNPPAPPWDTVDWDADRDWDWHSAADDAPEQLYAAWEAAVARSRKLVDDALAEGEGVERRAKLAERFDGTDWKIGPAEPGDDAPTLRFILCHMIEEYARHAGHADLLREAVDGLTGE